MMRCSHADIADEDKIEKNSRIGTIESWWDGATFVVMSVGSAGSNQSKRGFPEAMISIC